jgi:hypothetical protein
MHTSRNCISLAFTELGCIVVFGRVRCGGSVDLLADMWRAPGLPAFTVTNAAQRVELCPACELSMLSYALLIFR